jgi:hypothetical protein
MARHGRARRGEARLGAAWLGAAGQGKARQLRELRAVNSSKFSNTKTNKANENENTIKT